MSYTRDTQGAISSSDSASPGELVRGSRHFRPGREAPRDFGLMSGNVTGAYALLMQAQNLRDQVLGRKPVRRELQANYVPTNIEAMAELVSITHLALMETLTEIEYHITNSK